MLDQSFSADNFRKILDSENRKGVYLEGRFFPNLGTITEQIKQCNAEIRDKKKTKNIKQDEIATLKETVNKLKQTKEDLLMSDLQEVSGDVVARNFEIELRRIDIPNNKPLYVPQNSPAHYFAMKQLQRNVSRLFEVKQANRSLIVGQVKVLLGDGFPKYVVRADIEDFYESIPHEPILNKINGDNLLAPFSRKILRQVLNRYKLSSGCDRGLPRGIGVSAHLAELYMRDIDKEIKALTGVTYYARYVDDIVIVFTSTSTQRDSNYIDDLYAIIENKHGLKLNNSKTRAFDLRNGNTSQHFDYLGYRMFFGNKKPRIKLTKKKVVKYIKRINLTFDAYVNLGKVDEKKARKLLVRRIRYLTGNTRLANNKDNILVGIYYSNDRLTDVSDLDVLDDNLKTEINAKVKLPQVRIRLQKYRFREGFETKRFSPFTARELSDIVKVWKEGY